MAEKPYMSCPYCSYSLLIDNSICPSCENKIPRCCGILSFINSIESKDNTLEQQTIDQIAKLTEDKTIRTATNEVLGDRTDARQILRAIYDTRIDAWRMLVENHLDGHCLDLYTGWGRRSLAIAELVKSVYAVDPDLGKIRVLNARNDFDTGSEVVPIHADDKTLPFDKSTFDTIVADFTGRSQRVTKNCIETLDSMLRDDGSILLFVDGISRKLGISGIIGLDNSSASVSTNSFFSTINRCRRILKSLNYTHIRSFVLWPTTEMLSLVYDLKNTQGHQHAVESAMTAGRRYSKYTGLVQVAAQLGLLEYCFPNVLMLGSRDARRSEHSYSQPVVSTGRSRSVLFEYDDELLSVRKIPNRLRHSKYNEREHKLIRKLRTCEQQIQEFLPDGELIESSFGSIRVESPVEGRPLSESIGESPESRAKILSLGLDWLVEFQQPRHRERVTFSPREYVEKFEVNSDNFDLSQLSDPIHLFETPVHGDFLPENIYVENGNITNVIDWEYGCFCGNPIIDAGFFTARVIASGRKPTPRAMVELLKGQSQFAEVGLSALEKYCNDCDIDIEFIFSLFPIVYLHRINIDRTVGATMMYTNKEEERLERAKDYWNSKEVSLIKY